jgi:hypothetical protein
MTGPALRECPFCEETVARRSWPRPHFKDCPTLNTSLSGREVGE